MNTINLPIQNLSRRARFAMGLLTILVSTTYVGLAQQSAPQAFASAAEASQALFQAVQNNNVQAIKSILGGATDLASCGDEAQDTVERELFVEKYQQMHRVARDADRTVTLYIGAENWPFPVPLVEKNGAWRFDPDAGAKEVLFRRIGENELTAITICHEFVAAEKKYRAAPNTANPADSFSASLVARAAGKSAGDDPVLFQGYYFRVLATRTTNSGGFALIAYPAQYRSSGVMTFIVTSDDVVYDKDLGANTTGFATGMTTFHKDATWRPAEE
jgi:Protein of unknown function (DUF2950)